jgi:ABC-type transporter Mla maintaining outer membrane lipid asymmetry ATPase subunit MlaF
MHPNESNPAVIEMRNVSLPSLHAPERPEVEGISWTVSPGDYWVIAGLHGSGKSALLATAAGLLRPLHGSVLLFGRDTAGLKDREWVQERLRIGLIFENGGRLFREMTVYENVAVALRYHFNWRQEQTEQRVDEVLRLTGLEEYARFMPRSLSLLWQQRVALARALALKPDVLLLDKPLVGLELRHRRWWLDFLSRLSTGADYMEGRPITLVVTSDDFHFWRNQGRQFAVLNAPRWISLGGAEELKASADPLLQELLSESDRII